MQSLSLRIRETLRAMGHGEYTTHGLRKNAGIMLAENGATVPQIMAALGHKTPKMALYYCRLANQKLWAEQESEILDLAVCQARGATGGQGGQTPRRSESGVKATNRIRTNAPGNRVRSWLSNGNLMLFANWQHCDMNASPAAGY